MSARTRAHDRARVVRRARFVPIDTEKNLVKTGGNPKRVFLAGA